MAGEWFAPLDDDDRQLLVGSWVNIGVNVAATALGAPLLGLAAAPLQILVTRAVRMWTGADNRPGRAFAVSGGNTVVQHDVATGVSLDAGALLRRRAVPGQRLGGTFGAAAGTGLRWGDPVALVVNDLSPRAQGDAIVVPGRLGERYDLRVPHGDYAVSAFAINPKGRQLDPVAAIGAAGRVAGSSPMVPLTLYPRRQLTPTSFAQLRSQALIRGRQVCPTCGTTVLSRFARCARCGPTPLVAAAQAAGLVPPLQPPAFQPPAFRPPAFRLPAGPCPACGRFRTLRFRCPACGAPAVR